MALLLEQPSEFSDKVSLSYWKVCDTNINWSDKRYIIKVAGFIDEESRRAGKSPVKIMSYSFPVTFFPSPPSILNPPDTKPTIPVNVFPFSVDDNVVAKTYEILKSKPEWSEAKDV